MQALELLTTRSSMPRLQAPAPNSEQLNVMFRAAARAPDHVQLMPYRFIVFEQQPGVAVRKEIFRLRGLIASSHVRHPGRSIDAGTAQHLAQTLESVLAGLDIKKPLAL